LLRERLAEQGRVVLGHDGLKPDVGHEVLWVRDCLSEEVLLACTLLSEAETELGEMLREVQALLPAPIAGVISDGQHSIRNAVRSLLPDVPHQLCQYHCLREAAKPLYESDQHAKKELKKAVREIRPIERTLEGVLREQKSWYQNIWRNSCPQRLPLLRAIVWQFAVPSPMMTIPCYVPLTSVSPMAGFHCSISPTSPSEKGDFSELALPPRTNSEAGTAGLNLGQHRLVNTSSGLCTGVSSWSSSQQ
jgi:hypothetical protein